MEFLLHDLKSYSQISYRGCSQKFQNLNFLHLFVALLQEAHFSKGINRSFRNNLFLLISSDLCHKKMLLESLTIPLSVFRKFNKQCVTLKLEK